MKLNTTPRLGQVDPSLLREFREHANQVNALSEGRIFASYNAHPAAPTTGAYTVGDIVRNSAPTELGTAGSKYVIFGWMCNSASPLTFLQLRFLTGN